jgi:putative inorganic carbon (HCO3(-)) transporter
VLLLLLCAPPVALAAAVRPLEVLVALAALAAVVICTLRVELAVLLLVITAPLEFAITFGSGSQLTITKLAGAVCFAAFALNALATRRRLIFDSAHALVFLLLAIALVSMLQAEELSPAVVTTTRYSSFVALFFVVSQFVGAHNLQRRIAWTLSIGSTVTGVLASWNFLSGATLSARVGPGAGAPSDIAFILATTLPFTMWLLRERGVRRAAALVMTVAIAVSILLTLSRGVLAGLGAGLLWYTLAERRNGRALVVGAIAIGLALFLVVRLESHPIATGLHAKAKVASSNVQTRLEAWDAAANLAASHPVLGVGPGNFQFHFLAETGRPPGTQAFVVHDAYLDVAAELGLVAFVVFVAYLVLTFTRLTTAVRRGLGPPVFASVVRASLVIGVVAAVTLSEQYFAPFWLLGGLAAALVHERPSVAESE